MNNKFLLVVSFMILIFQKYSFSQDIEANKAIAKRYFNEVINQKKINLVDSIFDKHYLVHGLETGDEGEGSDQLKDFLPSFFNAFPDIHYTISDVIAEKDKVVIVARANGTQKEEFFGIQASNGKLNNLSEIFVFRISNNKIAEGWRLIDLHNLFVRLKGDGSNN